MAEDVVEIKRRSYPAKSWYRSVTQPKFEKRPHYVTAAREHAFCTYMLYQQSPATPRAGYVQVFPGGRTTVEARKAPSATRGYVRTVQTLIELLELPGGWNSYNARPIRKENVTFAVDLLSRLMREGTPAPNVVPKVRGGVQLEWHTRGIVLEISIDSPDQAKFFAEDTSGNQEPVEEKLDEALLAHWMDRLSG